MNPFTQEEREIIQLAIQRAREEIPDEGLMFSELPGPLQESYSWSELLALHSAMGNVLAPDIEMLLPKYPGIMDTMIMVNITIHKMLVDIMSPLRIQPCSQKGCKGYLIFINHDNEVKGKVPVMKLLPNTAFDHLSLPAFSEDMYGYVIAMCPWCGHIQLHDVPGGN